MSCPFISPSPNSPSITDRAVSILPNGALTWMPGDAVANAGDGFSSDLDAHGQLVLATLDRGHALHDRVGDLDARHLVIS